MLITTSSEKQTFKLGEKIACQLKGGEVLALTGELGTGKTVITKGVAKFLGIKKHITSPTFVLMKLYKIQNSKFKIQNFLHIDAYRLNSGQDLLDIGLEDWLNRPDTVIVIEWAERVKNILPEKTIKVNLKIGKKNNERIIKIENRI